MIRRASILALAFTAALASCSERKESDPIERLRIPPTTNQLELATSRPLPSNAISVLHSATRLVTVYDEGVQVLQYRERFTSDGQGRFSLRPIEALTPVASGWEQRQIVREGFFARYRDFSIRDKTVFARNYVYRNLGAVGEVAGRNTDHFSVEHVEGRRRFDLEVDRQTGLTLAYTEYGAGGKPVSAMRYESFDASPDLSAVVWYESSIEETRIRSNQAFKELGRRTLVPRKVPRGYYLVDAYRLNDGNDVWTKLELSDGVDTVFFLQHSLPTKDARVVDVGTETAIAVSADELPTGEILLFQMGATGVAQLNDDTGQMISVGKLTEDELVDMIESALP